MPFLHCLGPESPPQNITVSAVMTGYRAGSLDPMKGDEDDNAGASILVTWQSVAAVGVRGVYNIYLKPIEDIGTFQRQYRGGQRQDRRWDRHEAPGRQKSKVLQNLRTGQPYFLVMDAQNRYGRSPYSELCFFRTADGEFARHFSSMNCCVKLRFSSCNERLNAKPFNLSRNKSIAETNA